MYTYRVTWLPHTHTRARTRMGASLAAPPLRPSQAAAHPLVVPHPSSAEARPSEASSSPAAGQAVVGPAEPSPEAAGPAEPSPEAAALAAAHPSAAASCAVAARVADGLVACPAARPAAGPSAEEASAFPMPCATQKLQCAEAFATQLSAHDLRGGDDKVKAEVTPSTTSPRRASMYSTPPSQTDRLVRGARAGAPRSSSCPGPHCERRHGTHTRAVE